MNKARVFKYSAVFTLPVTVYIAFTSSGWLTYLTMLEAFFLIPLLELFIRPDQSNLSDVEEEMLKNDRIYDWMLYAVVPIHYGFLIFFLFAIQEPLLWWEKLGRISAMGIMCGVLGINVAHELGHRTTKFEQFLAKALLLTSLYMHFYIEHNRGHHKNVSTPQDPSSSRLNESLYRFWFRTVTRTYIGAWKLEFERMKKKGLAKFSWQNEMLRFQLLQWAFIAAIWAVFGLEVIQTFIQS
jgi:alkane 1-monooxygenase